MDGEAYDQLSKDLGMYTLSDDDDSTQKVITNQGITCNPQQPNHPFDGIYIERSQLIQHRIKQTLTSEYPVNIDNGVHLVDCNAYLKRHSYCVVDPRELGIQQFKLSEINGWTRGGFMTQRNGWRSEDIKRNLISAGIRVPADAAFNPIGGAFAELHRDFASENSWTVWIPFKRNKRLMVRSHETGEFVLSARDKAVIFYSNRYEEGENRSVWHAGFMNGSSADQAVATCVWDDDQGANETNYTSMLFNYRS